MQKVPISTETIDIRFETPTGEWATSISRPTVNLFLYDLRENLELRRSQRTLTRTGEVATERQPPAKIDLSYFLTAWTADVSDEHLLLGRLLTTLLRYPVLPDEVLKGAMQTQPPLHAWVAQPERTPNGWDFWNSLDGRLKAGISYAVTVAVEAHPPQTFPVVTDKVIIVHPKNEPAGGSTASTEPSDPPRARN